MILTKKTIITWDENFWKNFPNELRNFYFNKSAQLQIENKTDNIQHSNAHGIGIRYWVDESVANEWIQFVLLNFSIGDGRLINYEIQDI